MSASLRRPLGPLATSVVAALSFACTRAKAVADGESLRALSSTSSA
ncbi:MAG: hypothetical protein IT384_04085 [Deltaproteobacteria bacterium]|nr:hypothetical protein [Deltaproteobacteria bacterium]